jgi:HemX protein
MLEDRLWIVLATLFTLLNAGWGAYSLGLGTLRVNRWSDALLFLAATAQTVFLFQRGQAIGHCPVSNLFEVISFLTWSILLTYLLIGSTYRLSLLGFFTAPLVSLLNFFALVLPVDQPHALPRMGWALELHASVTVMAYGPLGLSAIAGFLYIIQERQLKQHNLGTWFYRLPAMGDLALVLRRVLQLGFALLSIGLIAGLWVASERSMDWVKISWATGVWALYGLILVSPHWFRWSARQVAWGSLLSYGFILLTFWGINSLSHYHRFNL